MFWRSFNNTICSRVVLILKYNNENHVKPFFKEKIIPSKSSKTRTRNNFNNQNDKWKYGGDLI